MGTRISLWLQDKWRYFVRVWHWSATWKWWDWLFIGAYMVSLGIHEFGIAIGSLLLCAFSLISLLWHGRRGIFEKCISTVAVCSGLTFLIYVTVQEKEDRDWSHISRPVKLLFQRTDQMRCPQCFVPTPDNWAAKQHFDTMASEPKAITPKRKEPYAALSIIGKGNIVHDATIIGGPVKVQGENNSFHRVLLDTRDLNFSDPIQVRRVVGQLSSQLQKSWESLSPERKESKSKELERLRKEIETSLTNNNPRKTSELLEEMKNLGMSP